MAGSSTTWSHKTASRIAREAERARKKHRQVRPLVAEHIATVFGGTLAAQTAAQEAVSQTLPRTGPVTQDSVTRALIEAQLILEMQDEEDAILLLTAA